MQIRLSRIGDLPLIMPLYETARQTMRANGNPGQWIGGYPSEDFIHEEILLGHSFVCVNGDDEIAGTFCFIKGEDPTYQNIYGGKWLNDAPYAVIHRMAASGKEKGVAQTCFDWCFAQCANIRVDTHRDNTIMRHLLRKMEFVYCGVIRVANGTERLAFQKSR